MKSFIGISAAAVFALIGLLHVYWALGGRLAMGTAVPQRPDGSAVFRPGRVPTATVALALWTASGVLLVRATDLFGLRSAVWPRVGCIGLAIVFLARAVGDFRLIGFFKTIRSTGFAVWDTWLYTPLCLVLAAACLLLGL